MKRLMVAAIGFLPIVAVTCLPQIASAQAVLRESAVAPWSIADRRYDNEQRDDWRNRNTEQRVNDDRANTDRANDHRYNDDRANHNRVNNRDHRDRANDRRYNDDSANTDRRYERDGAYRYDGDRRDQQRRIWIPSHWESGFLGIGRRWVEGHYENR